MSSFLRSFSVCIVLLSVELVAHLTFFSLEESPEVSSSTLHIITHHKSGTKVGQDLFDDLCTKWKTSDGGRYECLSNNVQLIKYGFDKNLLHQGDSLIHMIRHPLDMLISGYLYHKNCSEAWTSRSSMNTRRFPTDFPSEWYHSYCATLKKMNTTEGLKAELKRSLFSDDGIGKMLKDVRYLQEAIGGGRLLQVCLGTYTDTTEMEKLRQFMLPWKAQGTDRLDNDVSLVNANPEHRTNLDEHYAILDEAADIVKSDIPVEILEIFPCRSQYSLSDLKEARAFLEVLLARVH